MKIRPSTEAKYERVRKFFEEKLSPFGEQQLEKPEPPKKKLKESIKQKLSRIDWDSIQEIPK